MTNRIQSILTYPVKSFAGNAHDSILVTGRGFEGDRRWLVVDGNGRFITGRQLPQMTQILVESHATGITMFNGGERCDVARPDHSAKVMSVVVWADTVHARDAGDAAAAWLSAVLSKSVRLVYQSAEHRRFLPVDKRDRDGDEVSFADGYPILLIGTASLDELNSRLEKPVSMAHFRPNIIVETTEPFVEDDWAVLRVNDLDFRVASQCSRCIFTTVDPESGQRDPEREPLETLRQYRQDPDSKKIMFGVNIIPRDTGRVSVSDVVEPLSETS
ncbi:MAG: MOSC domain-containing protein [Woeseiaceae bacterium]